MKIARARCTADGHRTCSNDALIDFQDSGGSHHGTMKREKFCTALKDNFSRCYFTQELMDEITGHYGIGYRDPRGLKENVAWKVCTRPRLSTSHRKRSPRHTYHTRR